MVNRIWPTAVTGKADSVSSVSASACHIGGPNSVKPGQILLVYGKFLSNTCMHVRRISLGISSLVPALVKKLSRVL